MYNADIFTELFWGFDLLFLLFSAAGPVFQGNGNLLISQFLVSGTWISNEADGCMLMLF